MTKCVICEHRPATEGMFCAPCGNKINADRRARRSNEPKHYLTYQGHVVALIPNGGGQLRAQLIGRKPDHLPKGKTLDLNRYCAGYSREVIKRFKACVLQLAN